MFLQGAYAGLFSGLVFMFWIGVGAQINKPVSPKSPVFTTNCNWNLTLGNSTLTTTTMMYNTSVVDTTVADVTTDDR